MPAMKRTGSRIKLHDMPPETYTGGQNIPLEFPNMYRIQAGDWRISYAVEHNRLAILVLEVLTAEEGAQEDTARQQMSRVMKVRLLNSSEAKKNAESEVETQDAKPMIKILDAIEDVIETGSDSCEPVRAPRIRVLELTDDLTDTALLSTKRPGKSRVRVLEISEGIPEGEPEENEKPSKPRVRLLEIFEPLPTPDVMNETSLDKPRIKVLE